MKARFGHKGGSRLLRRKCECFKRRAKRDHKLMNTPLSDALRKQIDASGLSCYAIAKAAGIAAPVLSRWLAGKRGITLETADKIAAALRRK